MGLATVKLQTPSETLFGVGVGGLNTFSDLCVLSVRVQSKSGVYGKSASELIGKQPIISSILVEKNDPSPGRSVAPTDTRVI